MRRGRRTLTIATAAATLAFAAAATPAAAGPDQPIEVLRLDCVPRITDTAAAIRCEWSAPAEADAAGYRLWRSDTVAGRVRQVIFRTDDLDATLHLDTAVRRAQRYTYVVQAVNADGRLVGQSRAEIVGVPERVRVEALRLECGLAGGGDAVGCEWSPPSSPEAETVELWRSVDGEARELVDRFRPSGPNAYRDRVPGGASTIAYAVLARNSDGTIVARSRAQRVRIPAAPRERERPVVTVPEVRPGETVPEVRPVVTVPEVRPVVTVPEVRPEHSLDPGRGQGSSAPETRVGR